MKRKNAKQHLREELSELLELKTIGDMGLKVGKKEMGQIESRIFVIAKQLNTNQVIHA